KLSEGATVSFAALHLGSSTAARGAIDASHERGLFAAAYGPGYYRGFVDKNDELAPVPLAPSGVVLYTQPRRNPAGAALVGTGGALAIAGSTFAGLTVPAKRDFDATNVENLAADARGRYYGFQAAAIASFAVAMVTIGAGSWLLVRRK